MNAAAVRRTPEGSSHGASLSPTTGPRVRVLHTNGAETYASRGLELLHSPDSGRSFNSLARAGEGLLDRWIASAPVASRLLRTGFHGLTPLPSGDLIAIVRRAILMRRAGEDQFDCVHRVERGTRPLNVCQSPTGRLFFGEYFSNPERGEVHVYGSSDGLHWEVCHTFPAGSIRHVHGIHADPFRGGVWILTGDDDDESGLFWSDDDLRTVTPVVQGTQRARAVVVLPTPDGVVVPTDTPREQNVIQWLDPVTGVLEPACEVPGSVFTGGRTDNLLLVSTTVEKSDVNRDQRVALFASRDGQDWTPLARFERDLRILRDQKGYLQYPMLLHPSGVGSDRILATGQSLRSLHGRLLSWDESDVLDRMG